MTVVNFILHLCGRVCHGFVLDLRVCTSVPRYFEQMCFCRRTVKCKATKVLKNLDMNDPAACEWVTHHVVAGLVIGTGEVVRVHRVALLHVHAEHVVQVLDAHDAHGRVGGGVAGVGLAAGEGGKEHVVALLHLQEKSGEFCMEISTPTFTGNSDFKHSNQKPT